MLVKQDSALPHTLIVDIDGTVTMGPHNRGPFDWAKVGQDKPRRAVMCILSALLDQGYYITFLSGREDVCREETIEWLFEHLLTEEDEGLWELHMRPKGDYRPDTEIKLEIFDREIRDKKYVDWVMDDRPVVCRQWREMGLEVIQLGDPHKEF